MAAKWSFQLTQIRLEKKGGKSLLTTLKIAYKWHSYNQDMYKTFEE